LISRERPRPRTGQRDREDLIAIRRKTPSACCPQSSRGPATRPCDSRPASAKAVNPRRSPAVRRKQNVKASGPPGPSAPNCTSPASASPLVVTDAPLSPTSVPVPKQVPGCPGPPGAPSSTETRRRAAGSPAASSRRQTVTVDVAGQRQMLAVELVGLEQPGQVDNRRRLAAPPVVSGPVGEGRLVDSGLISVNVHAPRTGQRDREDLIAIPPQNAVSVLPTIVAWSSNEAVRPPGPPAPRL